MANDIILVVDDEHANRSVLAQILRASGYNATIAHDGFDALLRVAEDSPRLMISDLQMPRMSGFELLSVARRRFPEIAVIAMSGFYDAAMLPPCVICDAFFAKGDYRPPELLAKIAELLCGEHRAALVNSTPVPVWLPRGDDDYYIVTCTNCLRSFPVRGTTEVEHSEQHTQCLHCQTALTYYIEGRRWLHGR
jgi:CheY-like chemotaxis protein